MEGERSASQSGLLPARWPHDGKLGPSPPVSPTSFAGLGSHLPRDPFMRKLVLFSLTLALTAAWMVGCGDSKKVVTTQKTSFAFMQEASSAGSFLFSPMVGTFTSTGSTPQFSTSTVVDTSTNQPVVAEFYSIALSADGKKATLDMYGGLDGISNQWDIWVANSDGSSNPLQITNDTNNNRMPQLSPDSTKVVFNSGRVGSDNYSRDFTVIRNANGSGSEQVLPMPTGIDQTWAPTFSPDGSKIAVEMWGYNYETSSWSDGIWIMKTDGSNAIMLTNPEATAGCDCYDETPAFTSDGTKIVFSRDDWTNGPEVENIFVMNTDGTNVIQLTNNGAVNFDPMVLIIPGLGQRILFSSNADNLSLSGGMGYEIYSMNMDGTGVTRLTTNSKYDAFMGEWYEPGEGTSAALRHTRRSGAGSHPKASQGHVQGLKVQW